ncbi:hypothetical protein BJV78DRAFT_1157863 [Lactifluus subvellereus]|nr:hypothetical protein BJV78DRAFT_1157863 [Lactifluus subvellereus]
MTVLTHWYETKPLSQIQVRNWQENIVEIMKTSLFHGNFVPASAVPTKTKLLNLCLHKQRREFSHMRYSVAPGDPNDSKQNDHTKTWGQEGWKEVIRKSLRAPSASSSPWGGYRD